MPHFLTSIGLEINNLMGDVGPIKVSIFLAAKVGWSCQPRMSPEGIEPATDWT
jgi:hypothetical protein